MRGFGSPRRGLFSKAVGLGQLGLMLGLGCSTEAVAIKECREIEELRCEASVSCGIVAEDEVEGCKRFYKEQCLHGIAGDKEPSADQENKCVELLEEAQQIAAETLDDEDMVDEHESACAVIAAPWDQPDCEYLNAESVGGGGSTSDE